MFFAALFLWNLKFGVSFFLTPELKTALPLVPYLHLAMGLCTLLPAPAFSFCMGWRYTTTAHTT